MTAAVDLYWMPLGAGGRSVRFNGRVYEAVAAAIAHRGRNDIYHSSLLVALDDARFAIEMTPVPNGHSSDRGVVAEGSVGARWAGRFRVFRYEVRRWRGGVIPDLDFAVGRVRLTCDPVIAQRVCDLLPSVPTAVWGRDELCAGEMWTCNSIISWTLTRAGVPADAIALPTGGRAPGWDAGIAVANRGHDSEMRAGQVPLRFWVPKPAIATRFGTENDGAVCSSWSASGLAGGPIRPLRSM